MRHLPKQTRTSQITRLNESDGAREIKKQDLNPLAELGKFCEGCKKWYSFLKQDEKFCPTCEQRLKDLRS